jgi:purine-binding chemotaxis protein CheW
MLDPLDEFFWREDEVAPGFPDFVGLAPLRASVETSEARKEWLTFFLAGEEYAVAIEQVREILKAPDITEVPRAPAHVLGVIMVRGEVIAILDLRRRLALPTATPGRQARVLVCDAGDGPRGLLVDAVSNVVRLPPSSVEALPSGIGGPSAEYIAGIGRDRDRLFILLDLAAVLRDAAPGRPVEAR